MGAEVVETVAAPPIPHPRWRVPLIGDIWGISLHQQVQDSIRIGQRLGPIFERKVLGTRFVFATGADLVEELSDETRFAKHLGPEVVALRGIGGDGCSPRSMRSRTGGRRTTCSRPRSPSRRCARTTPRCAR